MTQTVSLKNFNNKWYKPGSTWKRIIWYIVAMFIFETPLPFPYSLKRFLLRLFGAKIGKNVVIKPMVKIKYPWFLTVGDYSWIGEYVWIDNLASVKIGNNVCISQGCYIVTGNHNYKSETFDLMLGPIIIEDGAWLGAKSIILPNSIISSHCVISAGSIVKGKTLPYTIYQGNPAYPVKTREICFYNNRQYNTH